MELELGLDDVKPMVGLQLQRSWWLGGQKLHIGASCLISSIADSGASMIEVGHEEAQQLGLLNPRLKDRCDGLS
jgi:hypothetical protein